MPSKPKSIVAHATAGSAAKKMKGKPAGRHVLVIHGPNLNLLGLREPQTYGNTSLVAIDRRLAQLGKAAGVSVSSFQSNHEGALVDRVQLARTQHVSFIIVNPAAYTHTSIALRDALAGVGIPFIEVHLSNVFSREPFRHHSCLSDIAVGVICGLGAQSYELAMRFALAQK